MPQVGSFLEQLNHAQSVDSKDIQPFFIQPKLTDLRLNDVLRRSQLDHHSMRSSLEYGNVINTEKTKYVYDSKMSNNRH